MAKIHATAVVDPAAELAADVEVGPGAVVCGDTVIGAGCVIGPHAQVGPQTVLGKNNRLYHGAIVGSDAQDLKYQGEHTTLRVGDNNIFREYCTVNRGTSGGGGETVIGSNCLLMVYSHVAHDCRLGNRVIMANAATLAGHISVDDNVTIGGLTPVHQFVRIGTFAFIGGGGWISMDVPPYMLVGGPDSHIMGINNVGLERAGVDAAARGYLKDAFRILYRLKLPLSDAVARIAQEVPEVPEVLCLLDFLRASRRGIIH